MPKLIPIYTWDKGVIKFNRNSTRLSKKPWFQGALLMLCVLIAMLLANLPFTADGYRRVLETSIQLHLFSADGSFNLLFPRDLTVEKFINDILMVVFFFTVGLEIKREITGGELSSLKKALLPVIAAFGGVISPALIYTLVNHGTASAGGWGIPTATDIAFAICILSALGRKVPVSLKVFLTALAIADDLIAILVVALFYGGKVNLVLLVAALGVVLITILLRALGEKRMFPYLVCALFVWILFYYSGIHATMSGVVMAFLIPSKPRYNKSQYIHKRDHFIKMLETHDAIDDEPFPNGPQKHFLRKLESIAHGTMDMSYRVDHALSPWVNFLIMPIFALANAGVKIPDPSLFNIFAGPELANLAAGVGTAAGAAGAGLAGAAGTVALGNVSLGIFLGLVIGKPLGITLFSWIAIKTGLAEMPKNASWPMFIAVACLGGIGFTMSIFVDTLSFGQFSPQVTDLLRSCGKIAVLMASICAGLLGSLLITLVSRHESRRASQ